jgi:hypothetical protein
MGRVVLYTTNRLSKEVFEKATFNKVNISTNQNETLMNKYKTNKNPFQPMDLKNSKFLVHCISTDGMRIAFK